EGEVREPVAEDPAEGLRPPVRHVLDGGVRPGPHQHHSHPYSARRNMTPRDAAWATVISCCSAEMSRESSTFPSQVGSDWRAAGIDFDPVRATYSAVLAWASFMSALVTSTAQSTPTPTSSGPNVSV